ncbi:MAG: phosphoadenosine phosphosulfate reductase family protein [Balneolaceae bacterium]|nr:phosphoadenosine phosphosulfate reductase family protein [Balneolaceae bacterium]
MVVNKAKINRSLSTKLVDARVAQVFNTFNDVLVTSSFGTTSAVLLHIISRVKPGCPVYFIDTGYHFEETLSYKNRLTKMLDLNVAELHPDTSDHETTRQRQMWLSDPDRCCKINKLEPIQKVKNRYPIWMSGVIGYQNSYRKNLDIIIKKRKCCVVIRLLTGIEQWWMNIWKPTACLSIRWRKRDTLQLAARTAPFQPRGETGAGQTWKKPSADCIDNSYLFCW